MGFPAILTGGNLTTIREGKYSATPRLLVNPNDVVFAAQVNQATFDTTFAAVTFDNVTTGVIADALDGFTVYIGATTDIRATAKSGFVGRIRDGSAGTTLNINETSAVIEDDWFIVVVKDVAIREKLGRYISKTMTVDWSIAFRQLLPRVTGLDSCYVGALVSGQSDFTFPAVGKATTTSATISSWLWAADGGSFINGTANTDAQPDIRYTVAGVYWPRVEVTDNGGRVGWFTMPVFVPSTDLSDDFVVTGLEGLTISSQLATGQEMTFNYFSDELDDVVKQTFVALWVTDDYAGSSTPILNEIAFVGRMRKENPKQKVDPQSGVLPEAPFTCEGVLGQLGRIRSPKMALTFDATPTVFGEINNMTQWRCASFILTEFSTAANVCSLLFDIEDSTYLNREDSTDDTSLLSSVNGLLAARKAALNQASTGQLFGARNANFMTDVQRNALDTITSFTTNDRFNNSIEIDQAATVGQITAFAGAYNSSDNTLRILRAIAPAVASDTGQGIGTPVNGVLLNSNTTLAAQKTEIEQIVADALSDANPKDKPSFGILDGYWFLIPTNYQWYGILMAATENNRGIVYDATDRFLLISVNLSFDNIVSGWTVAATLSHETQGGGAQTISQIQPAAVMPALPAIPTLPAYPSFPSFPSLWVPTGSIIIPPLGEGDADIVSTTTAIETETLKGNVSLWGDITELFIALDTATNVNPTWESKFTITTGYTIQDAKFDPFNLGAYVLENDGANNSKLWYTENVFESVPSWVENTTTLDDINYTTIRTSSTPSRIYIYGIDDTGLPGTVDLLNGNGNANLSPSGLSSPHGGSSNAPGVYQGVSDTYTGVAGGGGGLACNVAYNMPGPGAVLDKITYVAKAQRVGFPTGERICEVSLDGVNIGGTNSFGGGGAVQTLTIPKGPGLGLSGSTLLFHVSSDAPSGFCQLYSIELIFSAGVAPESSYRISDNNGSIFDPLENSGNSIGAADEPGYDSGAADDYTYLAATDIIREAENNDPPADKTDSDSVGTYAKAIWAYGKNAQRDIIFATDAAFGGVTMVRIVNDVASDITPDDGVDDGFVIGRNAICMSRVSDTHMWAICTFNVTTKLAYTDDAGATPWTISGESLTTGALYVRVKETNTDQVYIMDSNIVKYSDDGGDNFLTDRTAPGIAGVVFEVR